MAQITAKPGPERTERPLKKFEQVEKRTNQPAWVFPLRKAAIARFAERGFPTLQDEDWRFTNVAPIAELPFEPVKAPSPQHLSVDTIAGLTFGKLPTYRLVFVDGFYAPWLSSPAPRQPGVTVANLAGILAEETNSLQTELGRLAQNEDGPFTSLNTAFFEDGAFIHLRPNTTLSEPIHLLFISTSNEPGATTHPRNIIIAEKGSGATVLETYAGTVDVPYFTNTVTSLVLGEGAIVEHCKFQDESPSAYHMAAIHAHLGRSSNLIAHSIATGAKLSRNNIRTRLAGEGVECVLNGLFLTRDEQLADHHMIVEHAEPHCNSHEYYNGILDGRSKGVFHGRILVRQPAQKTDAKQTNKNLLLSEQATIDTKPQLEIYADDVKCTHGATVGQLNEESIFYLRARGIGAQTARQMLIHAFAGEIIERVRHTGAREELDRLIWDRLEANPHVGNSQ
jgi:Fe-S cluster assembly protein SufD